MSPELQVFAEQDAGYEQFCNQYDRISADPKTRKEYVIWVNDQMREEGKRDWIRQEVMEELTPKIRQEVLSEVRQEVMAMAEQKRVEDLKNQAISFARKMLLWNSPLEEIIEETGLTLDEIEMLRLKI